MSLALIVLLALCPKDTLQTRKRHQDGIQSGLFGTRPAPSLERGQNLFLDDKPSYWLMVYSTNLGHGANNLSISQAVTGIPARDEVFIWVRSSTGMSTEWASFELFLRDLVIRRHNHVTLCFSSPNETPYGELAKASQLQTLLQPVSHGRVGYYLIIDVNELIKDHTDQQTNLELWPIANCRLI
ncbi:hypothetical protein KCU98_g2016, partial [Aureobasidium melanogenum]